MKYREYYIIEEGIINRIAEYFDIDRSELNNAATKFGATLAVILTLVGLYNYNKLSDEEKLRADELRNQPALHDELQNLVPGRELPELDPSTFPPLPGSPITRPADAPHAWDSWSTDDRRAYLSDRQLQQKIDDILAKAEQAASWDEYVDHFKKEEGFRNRIYKDSKGLKTIGIGHLMDINDRELFETLFKFDEDFNFDDIITGRKGLTDKQVLALFEHDFVKKSDAVEAAIPKFHDYPGYVQIAIMDGFFRGDLPGSPQTLKHIKNNEWDKVGPEYINNKEYKDSKKLGKKHGVWQRMYRNYLAYVKYAESLKSSKTP